MSFKKRVLPALLSFLLVLALLPTSAAAAPNSGTVNPYAAETDTWTEMKQLRLFDPASRTAYFMDGDSYQVLDQNNTDFSNQQESWFLCEITQEGDDIYVTEMILVELDVEITIFIESLESDGENFRTANGGGSFQSAASFELPMTLTITNTTPVPEYLLSDVKDAEALTLDIHSVELRVPSGFVADRPENQSQNISLLPGEKWEYEGTIRSDTSALHIQNGKTVTHTVSATVTTDKDTFTGEGSFTVTLVDAVPNEGIEYEGILFPTLDHVTDSTSAAGAVKQMTGGMTSEQRSSPTGIDLATLYAEAASAKASSKAANSSQIVLNASTVSGLASTAAQASGAVETALTGGGVSASRYLAKTVTFTTDETKIAIQVNPDILSSQVDKIRVETPTYALTLKVSDLTEDLSAPLTIAAEDVGSGFAPGKANAKTTVKIDLPKSQMTNPVTVSLPQDNSDITYQAIVKTDGTATASKFNPATVTMDGKINTSGTYTVKTNEKSFTDISKKSAEMQAAILYLTSKGIISGTSATTFSPDSTINRQQIAALIMRALGKVDNTASTTFTDVPASSSLYHAIASSQKHGVINGYSDNTFRGANVISKSQIVTVSGRVLTSEMNYKTPSDIRSYLGKYSDTVPDYAREMVALATREGLVVYRTDGTFSGDKNMTRGDAAIILYRLFQKIW